jgi:hypothetical protein
MSNTKAGSMSAGTMWLFAIGTGIVGALAGFYTPGFLGFIVGMAIFIVGGWAAVHYTESSTGKGILGMLVAGVFAATVGFILWKTAAGTAMNQAGGQFDEAMRQAQAKQGAQMTAQQQQAMEQAGNVLKGAGGIIVGITAAFFGLLKAFLFGMVGCFIGGATKKSAIGAAPSAASKAA